MYAYYSGRADVCLMDMVQPGGVGYNLRNQIDI